MRCYVCDSELVEIITEYHYVLQCPFGGGHYNEHYYCESGKGFRSYRATIPYNNKIYYMFIGYNSVTLYQDMLEIKEFILFINDFFIPIERKYFDFKPLLIKLLKMKAFI